MYSEHIKHLLSKAKTGSEIIYILEGMTSDNPGAEFKKVRKLLDESLIVT